MIGLLSIEEDFVDLCTDKDGIGTKVQPKHDDCQGGQTAIHRYGIGMRDVKTDDNG